MLDSSDLISGQQVRAVGVALSAKSHQKMRVRTLGSEAAELFAKLDCLLLLRSPAEVLSSFSACSRLPLSRSYCSWRFRLCFLRTWKMSVDTTAMSSTTV